MPTFVSRPVYATVLLLLALPAPARAGESDEIYKRSVPGIVWIRNHIGDKVSSGTGFVIDERRGLIVTNHHVAQRELTVDVFFPAPDGKGGWITRPSYYTDNIKALRESNYYAVGYLAAYDPALDLAIIHVRTRPKYIYEFKLASADPGARDPLHIIGNPAARDLWRYCAAIEPKLGHIRTAAKNGEDAYDYKSLYMTSSAFPGNSGGPVVNEHNELVGVLSRAGGDGGKIAVAVHRQEVKDLLDTIIRHHVCSIENPSEVKLNYQLKWDDGEWQNFSVDPKTVRTHWLKSNAAGAVPFVRFDCSADDGFQEKSYKLGAYASDLGRHVQPNAGDHAKQYIFRYDKTGRNIDLYQK